MEDLLYTFDPGTHTSKCPLPTRFDHLLKFITRVEQYIALHSQEDIININSQLDHTTNLIISNIIQRVIAQIIGRTEAGFVTIKGTDDGQLHVYLAGSDPLNPIDVTLGVGDQLIGKVEIAGTSREVKRMDINKASADNSQVIALVPLKKLCLVNLAFTVSAEADIFLNSDDHHMTGEMDFGAANEPMGFVSNHGNFPLKTLLGEGFFIESDTNARIRGYVIYYEES